MIGAYLLAVAVLAQRGACVGDWTKDRDGTECLAVEMRKWCGHEAWWKEMGTTLRWPPGCKVSR